MTAYYTTKNGVRLFVFMWTDFFKNETWREVAEVVPIENGKYGDTYKKELFVDERGIHIFWDGEPIYLNEFEYNTVAEMAQRLEECVAKDDRWLVFDDEILATFLKDTENVGLIIDLPQYDMVIPAMGIGLVGDNTQRVLCIPTEQRYRKQDWHYKFTAECECEDLRRIIPSRHFYFSDFCSFLKTGHAKLVDRKSFIEESLAKEKQIADEKRKFSYKVKYWLGLLDEVEEDTVRIHV